MNILIADDHEIIIRGLKELLAPEFDDVNFGEATSPEQIQSLLEKPDWDLVLLDIQIPGMNVINMIEQINRLYPNLPILILTAVPENEFAVRTIKAGAKGYISKSHATEILIEAVNTVLEGGTYLSDKAVEALATGIRELPPESPHLKLSRRELEVFRKIAEGKSVKEIAFEISVSDKTVSTYIARIREKTGLTNYVDITRYALANDLVD